MIITFKNGACGFAALALVLATLAGCASVQWLTDYDTARETAALEGKNIFLLINSDTDDADKDAKLRKNVFGASALLSGLGKTFVPVNLDFTEARFNAAEEAGMGSPEEAQLTADMDVANKYGVESTPAVYLLTKEGYVIDTVEIDDTVTTGKELLARVNAKSPRIAEFAELLTAAETAEGIPKVRAIDALYEATGGEYREALSAIFRPVPALDPNNETGVVGKFLLQIAFVDAMESFSTGDMDGGYGKFKTAAANPLLTAEEKQTALLYLGIFIFQSEGSVDSAVAYFRQAIAAAPQSKQADDIKQLIDQLTQQSPPQSAPNRR